MNEGRKHRFSRSWGFRLISLSVVLLGCGGPILSTEAEKGFQGRQGPFTVTVYPVRVVKGETIEQDARLAGQLARFLQDENIASPELAGAQVEFPVTWGRNQAKMLRRSAEEFARHVRQAGIETDYALMAEILCNPDETRVVGVHYYLADAAGSIADCRLSNSHHKAFKQVDPEHREGGYQVLVRTLRAQWGRAPGT